MRSVDPVHAPSTSGVPQRGRTGARDGLSVRAGRRNLDKAAVENVQLKQRKLRHLLSVAGRHNAGGGDYRLIEPAVRGVDPGAVVAAVLRPVQNERVGLPDRTEPDAAAVVLAHFLGQVGDGASHVPVVLHAFGYALVHVRAEDDDEYGRDGEYAQQGQQEYDIGDMSAGSVHNVPFFRSGSVFLWEYADFGHEVCADVRVVVYEFIAVEDEPVVLLQIVQAVRVSALNGIALHGAAAHGALRERELFALGTAGEVGHAQYGQHQNRRGKQNRDQRAGGARFRPANTLAILSPSIRSRT